MWAMIKFNYRLGAYSILTLVSLILMQALSSQASTSTLGSSSDLVLFIRRESHGNWPFNTVVLDLQTGEERYLGSRGFCCAISWSPDGSRILVRQPDENIWRAATL